MGKADARGTLVSLIGSLENFRFTDPHLPSAPWGVMFSRFAVSQELTLSKANFNLSFFISCCIRHTTAVLSSGLPIFHAVEEEISGRVF